MKLPHLTHFMQKKKKKGLWATIDLHRLVVNRLTALEEEHWEGKPSSVKQTCLVIFFPCVLAAGWADQRTWTRRDMLHTQSPRPVRLTSEYFHCHAWMRRRAAQVSPQQLFLPNKRECKMYMPLAMSLFSINPVAQVLFEFCSLRWIKTVT